MMKEEIIRLKLCMLLTFAMLLSIDLGDRAAAADVAAPPPPPSSRHRTSRQIHVALDDDIHHTDEYNAMLQEHHLQPAGHDVYYYDNQAKVLLNFLNGLETNPDRARVPLRPVGTIIYNTPIRQPVNFATNTVKSTLTTSTTQSSPTTIINQKSASSSSLSSAASANDTKSTNTSTAKTTSTNKQQKQRKPLIPITYVKVPLKCTDCRTMSDAECSVIATNKITNVDSFCCQCLRAAATRYVCLITRHVFFFFFFFFFFS